MQEIVRLVSFVQDLRVKHSVSLKLLYRDAGNGPLFGIVESQLIVQNFAPQRLTHADAASYSSKPSLPKRFMKKLKWGPVVPVISDKVACESLGMNCSRGWLNP